MENVNKDFVEKSADTLQPIPNDERILGATSYLFAWLGGCISIGTFALGSNVVEIGLNLIQAFTAMLIGATLLIVGLILNDKLCYKTGIPYVVQLRSSFGMRGTIVPALLRAVPAIVWYGVQSWLAGTALNEVSKTLFSYDNVVLYFVSFQLLQIALSLLGFKGIKWLENIGACFIIIALIYMFYICLTSYGNVISENLVNIEGSWGLPFYGTIISFFGICVPVMLNCGDYSRELKPGISTITRGTCYFLAMVPATVFMGLIGLIITTATDIANPIIAFSTAVDNKILVVITLLFIIFAQMTTNLLNNVVPPVYALMDVFKIKHKAAAIIVGVLAVGAFPWELVKETSSAGLDVFILLYTVFFGPIFAVLVTDYYIVRKQKINVADLYDVNGPFKGINYAAFIAITVGALCGFIVFKISFFISFFPTVFIYYYLMKYLKSSQPFCNGTDFEKKEIQ